MNGSLVSAVNPADPPAAETWPRPGGRKESSPGLLHPSRESLMSVLDPDGLNTEAFMMNVFNVVALLRIRIISGWFNDP